MPFSALTLKAEIRAYILTQYPSKDTAILDIGAGAGTYARLLGGHYPNIDACEIWEPYIERFKLKSIYRKVYNCDISELGIAHYDLILMGDVLEHLGVRPAQEQIKRLVACCKELLVVVPFLCPQGEAEGNPNEIHLQADLTFEVMKARYGEYLFPRFWSKVPKSGDEMAVFSSVK